ncbi:MAG: hypothetical protein HY390_03020 [Deltaproteobacteria bacterium]|nr:hypothetical protein [Deltaproteobacteria bacterium]
MQYTIKSGLLVLFGIISFSTVGLAMHDEDIDPSKELDFQYCETSDAKYMVNQFEEDKKQSENLELQKGYQIFKARFLDTFERKSIDLTCSRYLDSYEPYQEVEFQCSHSAILTRNEELHVRVYKKHIPSAPRMAALAFGPYEDQNIDTIIPMFCE